MDNRCDLGTFEIEYSMKKKPALEKRLRENHEYTNTQIKNMFKKHNWDLEEIEDIILMAEKNNTPIAA